MSKKKHNHNAPPPPPPDKHEKKKEKKKRSGNGCLLAVILLILLIIALFFLLRHLGLFGLGGGKDKNGKGDGSKGTAVTSQTTEAASTTTESGNVKFEVTVSGEKYIFENNTTALDDLIAKFKAAEGNVIVYITCDDDAVDATVNDLKNGLNEEKIAFVEVEKDKS